ncbi:MAG: type IV secretory system conjugative DNA transfer family protein [Gluconacetobacter sp.]
MALTFAITVPPFAPTAHAQEAPALLAAPPAPQPTAASRGAGAAIDNPLPGALIAPAIEQPPEIPSLEAMMAVRPGYTPDHPKDIAHRNALRQAAWRYGARNGSAAENQVIRLMLNRRSRQLDEVFDFRSLVLPIGGTDVLMIPPVISETEENFALGAKGDTAEQTAVIDDIIRDENFVHTPPTWRTWLDRTVTPAPLPPDMLRPQTEDEVPIWKEGVATGFTAGVRQASEIFAANLNALQRDIMGMARYRVLLAAGKVHAPDLEVMRSKVAATRRQLKIDDAQVRVRGHATFSTDSRHWDHSAPDGAAPSPPDAAQ